MQLTLLKAIALLALVIQPGSFNVPMRISGDDEGAARLTLAILVTEYAQAAGIQAYAFEPSVGPLSLDGAVEYLAAASKPLKCTARSAEAILRILCREVADPASILRVRRQADELTWAYGRLLNEQCGNEHTHQVQVLVGQQKLILPLSSIESWLQDYDMPYTLPMWAKNVNDLPSGICARIVVQGRQTLQPLRMTGFDRTRNSD